MRAATPFSPAPDAATAAMPNGPAAPRRRADASSTPPIRYTTAYAALITSGEVRSAVLFVIASLIAAIDPFMSIFILRSLHKVIIIILM